MIMTRKLPYCIDTISTDSGNLSAMAVLSLWQQTLKATAVWTMIFIAKSAKLVLLFIARSNQRRALAFLDDRLLTDIGVERPAASQEAQKPFWKK